LRRSLVFSALFHAVLFAAIIFGVRLFPREQPPPVTVVELVELEEIAEEAASEEPPVEEPEAVPELEPEPEPEEVVEAPARVEEAPPAPAPEPEPTPTPKAPDKPKLVTEDIPNIRPKSKPKPPSRLNLAEIGALLDKREAEAKKTAPEKPKPQKKPTTSNKPKRTSIQEERMRASIQQAIASQVERCWSPPAGASYAETLIVKIQMHLRPDGNLQRVPEIMDKGRMTRDSFFQAAAEAAVRAIQKCAPFDLPKEDYDVWAFVELNFDPSKML